MGALGSTPVLSPFDFFKGWQLSQARDMLLAYRSRDFDFGIDASVVTSLIGVSIVSCGMGFLNFLV